MSLDTSARPSSDDPKPEPDLETGPVAQTATPAYPEGGWEAWSTVLGAWLMIFCTFGYTNSFGVFQSYYTSVRYTSESASSIAWIGSVQVFLQFTISGVAGALYDKGYFYQLTTVGTALFIFCFYMTSLAHTFWQAFLAQALGLGIAIGLLFLPAVTVVSQYFFRRRGIASGIVVTGSSVGGICVPIMLNKLFLSHGFARGVQYTGILLSGLMVVSLVLMRPFGGVRRSKSDAPVDVKAFFKEPAYLLFIAGIFLAAWGLFFPIFFIQVFAEQTGASADLVFYTLAILNAGSILGRTLPNFLADIIGPLNLFSTMSLLTSIMAFALFGANKSTACLIVVTVLYGVTSGAFISLLSPAVFSFAKSQAEIGKRAGLAFVGMSLAALTGSPIGGALVQNYGFNAAIAFCGTAIAAGGMFVTAATVLKAREKGTWKV